MDNLQEKEVEIKSILADKKVSWDAYCEVFGRLEKYWKDNVYYCQEDHDDTRKSLFEFGNRMEWDKFFSTQRPVLPITQEYLDLLREESRIACKSVMLGRRLNELIGYDEREAINKENASK
jgi:hypothetical protein